MTRLPRIPSVHIPSVRHSIRHLDECSDFPSTDRSKETQNEYEYEDEYEYVEDEVNLSLDSIRDIHQEEEAWKIEMNSNEVIVTNFDNESMIFEKRDDMHESEWDPITPVKEDLTNDSLQVDGTKQTMVVHPKFVDQRTMGNTSHKFEMIKNNGELQCIINNKIENVVENEIENELGTLCTKNRIEANKSTSKRYELEIDPEELQDYSPETMQDPIFNETLPSIEEGGNKRRSSFITEVPLFMKKDSPPTNLEIDMAETKEDRNRMHILPTTPNSPTLDRIVSANFSQLDRETSNNHTNPQNQVVKPVKYIWELKGSNTNALPFNHVQSFEEIASSCSNFISHNNVEEHCENTIPSRITESDRIWEESHTNSTYILPKLSFEGDSSINAIRSSPSHSEGKDNSQDGSLVSFDTDIGITIPRINSTYHVYTTPRIERIKRTTPIITQKMVINTPSKYEKIVERPITPTTPAMRDTPQGKYNSNSRHVTEMKDPKKYWRNAFPPEVTGGFYNLRFQSLMGSMPHVDDIFQYFTKEAVPNASVLKGLSSLHAACLMGHMHIIEYLLREDADPNQESHSGTPLQIAILQRNPSIVQKLLDCSRIDCNRRCTIEENYLNPELWNPSETYEKLSKTPKHSLSEKAEDSVDVDASPAFLTNTKTSSSFTTGIITPNSKKYSSMSSSVNNKSLSVQRSIILKPNRQTSISLAISTTPSSPTPSHDIPFLPLKSRTLHTSHRKRTKRGASPIKKLNALKASSKLLGTENVATHFLEEEQKCKILHESSHPIINILPLAICIDINFIEGAEMLLRQKSIILEEESQFEAMNRCVYRDRPEILKKVLTVYRKRYAKKDLLRFHLVALRKAVLLNRDKVCRILLEFEFQLAEDVFQPIFVELIKRNILETFRVVLELGGSKFHYIQYLIFTTVQLNSPSACDMLLKSNISPDIRDSNGFTALQLATQYNLKDMVTVLLSYKANPNIYTPNTGHTSLHLAVRNQNYEIASQILKFAQVDLPVKLDTKTALQTATLQNDVRMVRILLESSPNLEACSSTVAPVLHIACIKGYIELVDLFLEAGANIEFHYRAGTPFHNLIIGWNGIPNRESIFSRLVGYGSHIDSKSHSGLTPLQLAVEYDALEVIPNLVKLKVNINIVHPHTGDSLIHLVARKGNHRILKALLLLGVWPKSRNNFNQLPQDVIPKYSPNYEACMDLLSSYNRLYECLFENPEEPLVRREIESAASPSKPKNRYNTGLVLGKRASINWRLKDPPSIGISRILK